MGAVVLDRKTREQLRRIAGKRLLTRDDIEFVKSVGKERHRLFRRADKSRDTRMYIRMVAKEELGDAIERVLDHFAEKIVEHHRKIKAVEQDEKLALSALENARKGLDSEIWTVYSHMKAGLSPGKISKTLKTSKEQLERIIRAIESYEEAHDTHRQLLENLDRIEDELKGFLAETPFAYTIYVTRKGGEHRIHPRIRELQNIALEEKIRKIIEKMGRV